MLIIKFIFIKFAGQGGIKVTSKVICKDVGKVSIAISNQHKNWNLSNNMLHVHISYLLPISRVREI